MGMLHVLEAARRHGVKRIVYSASSSAYGDDGEGPKSEALAPHPMSPYAAAKCAGELLVSAYAHSYGLSAVSLRYFNVFGARQQPDSPYAAVLPRFAERLIKGQKAIIYGDGTQTRDFTPVANAVHANLLAGSCTRELRGEVVNIACGRAITVLELLERTAELLGEPATHELVPPRIGDILHSRASIDEARALIGYEPVVSFEEGMKEAVAYYVRIFGQ